MAVTHLYSRSRNFFILLHIIEKPSGTISERDIHSAERRFRARMDAVSRLPPRAAGHDAPPTRRGARA